MCVLSNAESKGGPQRLSFRLWCAIPPTHDLSMSVSACTTISWLCFMYVIPVLRIPNVPKEAWTTKQAHLASLTPTITIALSPEWAYRVDKSTQVFHTQRRAEYVTNRQSPEIPEVTALTPNPAFKYRPVELSDRNQTPSLWTYRTKWWRRWEITTHLQAYRDMFHVNSMYLYVCIYMRSKHVLTQWANKGGEEEDWQASKHGCKYYRV